MSKGIASKYIPNPIESMGKCSFCGEQLYGISHDPDTCIDNLRDQIKAIKIAQPQITFDTSKSRYLLTIADQTHDITEGMQQIIRFETALIKKKLVELQQFRHCGNCGDSSCELNGLEESCWEPVKEGEAICSD